MAGYTAILVKCGWAGAVKKRRNQGWIHSYLSRTHVARGSDEDEEPRPDTQKP